MSVASRYINRELIAIFAVTLIMLLLVGVGGRFIGYLQEAAMGKFTGSTVLTIIGLRMPEFVQLIAPFAMYVAIVLTLGRLHAEQEMVVLQGAGTSTAKLLAWISRSLLGVVAMVALLSWLVTPLSQRVLVDFMAEQRAQSEFETVNPGIFHVYDLGRRVTYSEEMSEDRRVLHDVFLSQQLDDGRTVNIWAESGRQQIDPDSGSHFLILSNGRRYEGTPGEADFRIMEFSQLNQRLELSNRRGDKLEVEAMPSLQLGDDPASRAEWHWRLAQPLFALIGGLLAVGISRVKPRQGRFARVVPGMLLMLLYYLALLVNQNAVVEQQVPHQLGLWLVHGLFLAVACYFLSRLAKPVVA
jgi:lipopolysaccharide export system permease protein